MTVVNIIDNRAFKNRFNTTVNVVAEPAAHYLGATGTDTVAYYERMRDISVADAIKWANDLPGDAILFLYDQGSAI